MEADGPAEPCLVADLDGTRIAQRFVYEILGNFRWLAPYFEIGRFDERVWALPLVGFGKSHYCTAERSHRADLVVAVLSAKPRCRNEERARGRNLVVQGPHGGIERLDAHTDGFAPGCRVQFGNAPFDIQCGQPIDSVYWPSGDPILQAIRQGI